jgi:hypothetical protein
MGANRSGDRRKARLRRAKRLETRLSERQEAPKTAAPAKAVASKR